MLRIYSRSQVFRLTYILVFAREDTYYIKKRRGSYNILIFNLSRHYLYYILRGESIFDNYARFSNTSKCLFLYKIHINITS